VTAKKPFELIAKKCDFFFTFTIKVLEEEIFWCLAKKIKVRWRQEAVNFEGFLMFLLSFLSVI
jgi:hypothetical protein